MITKRITFLALSFWLLIPFFMKAQSTAPLKGILMELVSSEPVAGATIKNTRTQQEVISDKSGNFSVSAHLNDILTIKAEGYKTDTIFLYDESLRRIYLQRDHQEIVLNEVLVSRMTDSRLKEEIATEKAAGKFADVSQNKGGLRISPSRVFGKAAKEARSNYKLLLFEQEKRKIDKVFTDKLIQSLTPLEGKQLALFKEQYRPTIQLIESNNMDNIRLYIIDSYKKFNAKNK